MTSPDRLRVLQLGMGWFPEQAGGLNRVYYDLVRSLGEAGVDCRGIITGSDLASRETHGAIRAAVPTDAPLLKRWKAIRQATAAALAGESIDVVAAHFAVYAHPALPVIRGRPFVYHFHGPWAAEGAREGAGRIATAIKAFIERRVYRRADLCIVLSEAFKQVLCDSYGVSPSRVRIVPGGVDCARYDIAASKAEARQTLNWPTDRTILVAVRRLVPRMGLEDLIAAVAVLRQKHPKLLLCIAGKGPLSAVLQQQINAAGLADHVRLLGYVPDEQLPLIYRSADCSIVPTVALEGFGLIAIESLAAGTPVIVTPVGGLPEVVRGLSSRLICAASGVDALVRAIESALVDATYLPDRSACQHYARENFDLPVIARKTRAVYEEAKCATR